MFGLHRFREQRRYVVAPAPQLQPRQRTRRALDGLVRRIAPTVRRGVQYVESNDAPRVVVRLMYDILK